MAALYEVTKDERTREISELYMSRLLPKFQRPDGLWERSYNFDTKTASPTRHHTRGQGWAMEGLVSSAKMRPEGKYKELAERMAEQMMKWQHESGYWTYLFSKPVSKVGISEKGTALWSLLFYRLYAITENPAHLKTARKALEWCMDNQYAGNDPDAYGSLVGITPQSGVTYRNWFPLSCTYTSGFFGLAALEELKIMQDN